MVSELFRGATTVRQAIQEFLADVIPVQIALSRTQWDLDEYLLPLPKKIYGHERNLAQNFPEIQVSVSNANAFTPVSLTPAAEEQYEAKYNVMIVTFVNTPQLEDGTWADPEYEACMQLRDDMVAVVRACLLGQLSLGQPNAMQLTASTLDERYSDATKPNDSTRWVAAGSHQFTLWVDESLVRSTLGNADTIYLDVHALSS